jgi:hypothetical protein
MLDHDPKSSSGLPLRPSTPQPLRPSASSSICPGPFSSPSPSNPSAARVTDERGR